MERINGRTQAARAAAEYSESRRKSGIEPSTRSLEMQVAALRAHRSALAAQASVIEAFAQAQLALAAWQPVAAGK
jgi:outer membrane protein, multidrug efflux system